MRSFAVVFIAPIFAGSLSAGAAAANEVTITAKNF